jgi:hypothetical protein
MLFSSLSWVLLTLTLLVALPGALASSSPKRAKKSTTTRVTIETYPAMEDGEILVPRQTKIPSLEPKAIERVAKNTKRGKSSGRVQTLGSPAPVSAPNSAPAAYVTNDAGMDLTPVTTSMSSAAPAPAPEKFVVVPTEKRSQIMKRMNLCQDLFKVTGRAYDYRSMTTAELEAELRKVTADSRPVAAINLAPAAASEEIRTAPNSMDAASSEARDPILDAEE